MPDIDAAAAPAFAREGRLELLLNLVIVLLFAAVLGLASWFAFSVWTNRRIELYSTPAMRAIQQLQARAKARPNDAALRVRLGEALASAGLDQDAIAQFKMALKIDPKHTGATLDLGIVAMNAGDRRAAEGYFQRVLELTSGGGFEGINERREIAYFNLGLLANQAKQYEDAVGDFKAALRIRRDASDTYYNLALAYEGLGEPEQAMKQLEAAIAFDPGYAAAQYEMAKLYLQQGDKVNAAVHLRAAADAAPKVDVVQEALASLGSEQSWLDKATTASEKRDYQAAVDAILVARALAPDNASAAKLHAQILERKGNLKGALDVYQEALKIAPGDPDIKAAVTRLSSKKAKGS